LEKQLKMQNILTLCETPTIMNYKQKNKTMETIQHISIKEAMKIHNRYKSAKGFMKWCERSQVKIFSDESSSGRKYILRSDLEAGRLKQTIQYFKIRYAERWFEAFQAHAQFNLLHIISLDLPSLTYPYINKVKPVVKTDGSKNFDSSIGARGRKFYTDLQKLSNDVSCMSREKIAESEKSL